MTTTDATTATAAGSTAAGPPALTAIHHVGITVTDLARSVAWYAEVLGMVQWGEETYPGGRTALLVRPGTHVHVGLDAHEANEGERFAPHRTGLDHLSLMVASRDELVAWRAWLGAHDVPCGEVADVAIEGLAASLLSFRDPDGVALELIWMAG
jgi:glyoxylase I family protein